MNTNLQELNLKIAAAENQPDAQFFTTLLSENLLFRRANGEVVGKGKFLTDLQAPKKTKLTRTAEDIQVTQIPENGQRALVTLIVCTVDEQAVEKRYRNVRLFTRAEAAWVLEFWYNYEIASL